MTAKPVVANVVAASVVANVVPARFAPRAPIGRTVRAVGTITDAGTIVGACDVLERRGEVAIWTGQAIGGWAPSDIVNRGVGGSETAAFRLAEELARMRYLVTLYGDFTEAGGVAAVEKMLADTEAMASYRPSMKLDFDAGRPLEVEALYARPIAAARAAGVACPRIEELHADLVRLDPGA